VNSRKKKGTHDTYYGLKKLINTVKVKRVKFLFLSTPLRHVGGIEVQIVPLICGLSAKWR
jgi:hypothetical protein